MYLIYSSLTFDARFCMKNHRFSLRKCLFCDVKVPLLRCKSGTFGG